MSGANFESDPQRETHIAGFAERVRANQQKLMVELKPRYDFIVCGSGSSGSIVARRLAENAKVSVLLLEAGRRDDMLGIMEAGQWPVAIGSEQDWAFMGWPNPNLNGRSIQLNMGKVLGGGSSINAMAWARGHKNDWDFFAAEARDAAWSYDWY
jgi:choline dehydrogenase